MNKNYKLAIVFSLIPMVLFLLGVDAFVFILISEDILHIDTSTFFPLFTWCVLFFMFGGLPVLISAILGIIFSIKTIKINNIGILFLILSIVDVFISIALFYAFYFIVFIAGPSV